LVRGCAPGVVRSAVSLRVKMGQKWSENSPASRLAGRSREHGVRRKHRRLRVDAACIDALTAMVTDRRWYEELPQTQDVPELCGYVAGNTLWLVRCDLRSAMWRSAQSPCTPSFVMFLSRDMWHHSEPFFVDDFRFGYSTLRFMESFSKEICAFRSHDCVVENPHPQSGWLNWNVLLIGKCAV
jgi:hypothetical protein